MRWQKVFRPSCRARRKFWRRTIYVTASVAINKMESTFGDGWGMKGIRECGWNWFLIGKYAPRWSMCVVNASMRENFASLCALVLICALTYVKDQKKMLWRTVTNMHQSRRTGNDESLSNENDLEERNGRHHFDALALVNQTYGN